LEGRPGGAGLLRAARPGAAARLAGLELRPLGGGPARPGPGPRLRRHRGRPGVGRLVFAHRGVGRPRRAEPRAEPVVHAVPFPAPHRPLRAVLLGAARHPGPRPGAVPAVADPGAARLFPHRAPAGRGAGAMKIHPLHSWDVSATEAVALQRQLAGQVDVRTPLTRCELVAGADVSYNRDSDVFFAAVVVLRTSDWSVVETQGARKVSTFPYVPGLLSFREAPVLLEAFAKVQAEPDVVMLDGQGIAHMRRLGLASHVGLWLDRPCLGCAKSVLFGKYKEPGPKAGSLAPLLDRK